jgi:hypothetical protein
MKNPCHDCGAKPGEYHKSNCDVERCPFCGGQALQCFYENSHGELECECKRKLVTDADRMPWTGEWPGEAECVEYGFYSYFDHGWKKCGKDHPGAGPDLNRLMTECVWSRKLKKFVPKPKQLEEESQP